MKLLQDIKQCRTTFDTSDTRRSFGPIVVDYAKVQSKVSLKYDSWHKDVLSKFGQLLGQEMTQFHAQVSWMFFIMHPHYSLHSDTDFVQVHVCNHYYSIVSLGITV